MKPLMSCLRIALRGIIPCLVLLGSWSTVRGQLWTQYDQGTPPQHAIGVSPVGSYVSTEIGTVNLSNGALNIHLPLGSVGGRGFSIPISLNYSSKVWSVAKDTVADPFNQHQYVVAYAAYGEGSTATGWRLGDVPSIDWKFVGIGQCADPNHTFYDYGLDKLSVVMPDGGEIELRDDTYDGAAMPLNCDVINRPRANRWHATDGSGTIFVFDNRLASFKGTLIMADGTRYRFDSDYPGSSATSITDRNGNQITITRSPSTGTTEYIDQLGRSTKVESGVPDPANSSVILASLVTFKGYQGTPQYYKIKTDALGNHIRADFNYDHQPILTGAYDPYGFCYHGGQPPAGHYLFPNSYCEEQWRIDNQNITTELILPDGRSLHFNYNLYGEVAEVVLPTGAKLQYDYADGSLAAGNTLSIEYTAQANSVSNTDRAVIQRRTYPDGSTLEGSWTYTFSLLNNGNYYASAEVKAFAGIANSGPLLADERHYFLPANRYLVRDVYSVTGTGYSLWSTGTEWRTETLDGSGNPISAVERDWAQRASVVWPSGAYDQSSEQPANDNRISETRHYLDTGSFAKTDTF